MDDTQRRGYSLSSLFVLVTASAALVAGFTPLVREAAAGNVNASSLAMAAVGGLLGGMFVGLIVGLLQFRVGMAVLMGGAAGAFIGMAAGMVALLPLEMFGASALALVVGSGLVVAVSLVNRRVNG